MSEESILSLLEGDELGILMDHENWPKSVKPLFEIVDSVLVDRPDLKMYARPAYYLLSSKQGCFSHCLPSVRNEKSFFKQKRWYDLYLVDQDLALKQRHLYGINSDSIDQVLHFMQEAHDSADQKSYKQKWPKHTIRLMTELGEIIKPLNLPESDQYLFIEALLHGKINSSLKNVYYLPRCNSIDVRILALNVMKFMRNGNPDAAARHFNISLVHVYRICREERKRQKEARDKQEASSNYDGYIARQINFKHPLKPLTEGKSHD